MHQDINKVLPIFDSGINEGYGYISCTVWKAKIHVAYRKKIGGPYVQDVDHYYIIAESFGKAVEVAQNTAQEFISIEDGNISNVISIKKVDGFVKLSNTVAAAIGMEDYIKQ